MGGSMVWMGLGLSLVCSSVFDSSSACLRFAFCSPSSSPQVASALKESSALEVHDLDVRRRNPLAEDPDAMISSIDDRSVLVKPLPMSADIESLEEFFGDKVGKVNSVRIR